MSLNRDLLRFHGALLPEFDRTTGELETEVRARGVDEIPAFCPETDFFEHALNAVTLKFIRNDIQVRGLVKPLGVDGHHGATHQDRINP